MSEHRAAAADLRLLKAAHPVTWPLVNILVGDAPARRVPGVGVLVADPVLIRKALTDNAFRKDGPGSSGALWAGVLGHRTLIGMDGPPHRRLRRVLAPLFTPEAARTVCAHALASGLHTISERLAAGEEVDLVPVARDAATAVIAALIGLDPQPGLAAAGDEVLAMVGLGTRRLNHRQVRRVQGLLRPVAEAARAGYDSGAHAPGCVMGRLAGAGISREQAPSLAAVLLLTGTETVVSAAPRAVAMLADAGAGLPGPDDPALDAVVTEAIRLATPSPAMLRRATRATRLGPVTVHPGDRVLLLTWWGTRLPGGFRPGRDPGPTRHLAFGAGAHQCLGLALAHEEVRLLVGAVAAAGTRVQVVSRRPARQVLVPGYRELTVRVNR